VNYLPFVLFAIVVVVLLSLSARARRRQATAEISRTERIVAGSAVMTTSGLYGRVVARHDDGTVTLAIAPGVEVRWEFAALRDAESLPESVAGRANLTEAGTDTPIRLDKSDRPAGPPAGADQAG
jgi:preprotein translocase subunit YajC